MLAALILGLNLLTDTQLFDVYSVDNQYIESAYKMADEIMLHYDDLEDQEEFEVEEVPEEEIFEEIGEEIIEEDVPEELSEGEPSEEPIVYAVDGDNSEIVAELKKNNENWDLFLDSYSIHVDNEPVFWEFSPFFNIHGYSIRNSGIPYIPSSVNSAIYIIFIPTVKGRVYHIDFSNTYTWAQTFIGYCNFDFDSITSDDPNLFGITPLYSVTSSGNNSYSSDYVAVSDYLVFRFQSSTYSFSLNLSVSYDYFESYTLSELGNAVMSINEKVDNMTKYNDYEIYTDESSFENSVMYINKYQFETFKLLKYLVILAACQIGTLFLAIFTWRRSKHGNT